MKDTDFLAADWPAPPGVVAGTTLRSGGASTGPYRSLNLGLHVGDEQAAVRGNRAALAACLALPAEPAWLRQVHGAEVVAAPFDGGEPEADACWTAEAGVVCAVMTADCLPVLLAARDGSRIAAVHAGWRGLAAGVLERGVAAIGGRAAEPIAWLGPAISQPAYEVGAEVRDVFVSADPGDEAFFEANARGRFQADLYGLARRRLEAAGVAGIHGGGFCTSREEARFFSHRRDGRCGRMATLIFRRREP